MYSKQKRHSDVSSVRSNTIKVANSKRPHRHSVFTPMPTRSKGQLVSVESQLSNADSYRHVAVPLDKSFIENEVSKVDLQKYFSDTRMNQYNTKKWSIATPSSTKREFDMPLKKPRQSLPSNVPSSYSDTERKFSYDPTKTSPCNTGNMKLFTLFFSFVASAQSTVLNIFICEKTSFFLLLWLFLIY